MTRAKGSSALRCDIKVATSGWALSILFKFFFAGFFFLGIDRLCCFVLGTDSTHEEKSCDAHSWRHKARR